MTCKEIIENYLRENGFDGLVNTDLPCGCDVDSLFPCECEGYDCQPAYKKVCEECNKYSDCNSDCKEFGECFCLSEGEV